MIMCPFIDKKSQNKQFYYSTLKLVTHIKYNISI